MRTLRNNLLLLAAVPFGAAHAEPVIVNLRPRYEYRVSGGPHAGHVQCQRLCRFGRYSVAYKACVDPSHGKQAAPIEGYIGMPRPSSANWYHSGFLFIIVNGQDIGAVRLSSMMVTEREPRAMVDLVWHHDTADVRVRFARQSTADPLLCAITIDPRQPVKSLVVRLRCYPSFFTSWHKRVGARRIQTPTRLIRQGERVVLPGQDAWWCCYYDEVFDVARGEGDGPCGLMFVPDNVIEARFECGGYAVTTDLRLRPDGRGLRLGLWDFTGKPNAAALAEMAESCPSLRDRLTEADFTPSVLSDLDLESIRALVARADSQAQVRQVVKDRLAKVRSALATVADSPAETVRGQEALLLAIEDFRALQWEVRLAELLAAL